MTHTVFMDVSNYQLDVAGAAVVTSNVLFPSDCPNYKRKRVGLQWLHLHFSPHVVPSPPLHTELVSSCARGSQSGSPVPARRGRHFSSAASWAHLNPMPPPRLKNTHFKMVFLKLFWVLLFSDQNTVGSSQLVSPPQTVSSSQILHFYLIYIILPDRAIYGIKTMLRLLDTTS